MKLDGAPRGLRRRRVRVSTIEETGGAPTGLNATPARQRPGYGTESHAPLQSAPRLRLL